MGFAFNNKLKPSLHRCWKVSERICVLQLNVNKGLISIFNVYAPHSGITQNDKSKAKEFYRDLDKARKETKGSLVTLLAGDFNSKVGRKVNNHESCLGSYSRGRRNENGLQLVNFCETNELVIANSLFQHRACHITTWEGSRRINGELKPIFNQIDFIICSQKQKKIITNARSYSGMKLSTDHRLVIARLNLRKLYDIWDKLTKQNQKEKVINSDILEEAKEEYERNVEKQLFDLEPQSINWNKIKEVIIEGAKATVGYKNRKKRNQKQDPQIKDLSNKQKELRIKIKNTRKKEKQKKLKNLRNQTLLQIRRRSKECFEKELEGQLKLLEASSENKQMFIAMKELLRKKNRKNYLLDQSKKEILNEGEAAEAAKSHFQQKLYAAGEVSISRDRPTTLHKPISFQETKEAIMKLNNGKSGGEDEIVPELLKYVGNNTIGEIVKVLNNMVEGRIEDTECMGKGILITLQKPGKPKGYPENLRPITLLNTIRKILSNIVLKRIRPKIEEFLSPAQAGFRKGRSTTDVVWTHKWLIASATTFQGKDYWILGVDLSQAFDTVNRRKLLEILKPIVDEDELSMIKLLLEKTELMLRWNNAKSTPFETNLGIPQGDGLSPILFIVYLEWAIRDFLADLNKKVELDHTYAKEMENQEPGMTPYLSYADDTDFLGKDEKQMKGMEQQMKRSFEKWNLKVNLSKTELIKISRSEEAWKLSKKLGTLLGEEEEISRRKQLAQLALNRIWKVWLKGKKIRIHMKIRIYNAYVKPVLLYNAGTWATNKQQEEKLDAFHRKQLKRVLNIYYPNRISNKELYKRTGSRPISVDISKARMKMLGHILRMKKTPAYKAMEAYFNHLEAEDSKKFAGRPRTNIYVTIKKDLKLADIKNLESKKDLSHLQSLAEDRVLWRRLVYKVTQEKLKNHQ